MKKYLLMTLVAVLLCCGTTMAAETLTVQLWSSDDITNPVATYDPANPTFTQTFNNGEFTVQVAGLPDTTGYSISVTYGLETSDSMDADFRIKDAGSYKAHVTLTQPEAASEADYLYTLPGFTGTLSKEIQQIYHITVDPQPVVAVWDATTSMVYNGNAFAPSLAKIYKEGDDTQTALTDASPYFTYYSVVGTTEEDLGRNCPSAAGEYKVKCSLGNTNYSLEANSNNQCSYTINPCVLTLNTNSLPMGMTYIAKDLDLTYVLTGNNQRTYDEQDGLVTTTYTYSTENTTDADWPAVQNIHNAGYYRVTFELTDENNYAFPEDAESVVADVTVHKSDVLVDLKGPEYQSTFVYNRVPQQPLLEVEGILGEGMTDSFDLIVQKFYTRTETDDYAVRLDGPPTDAGDYTLVVSMEDDINYQFGSGSLTEQMFTIMPASVTITEETNATLRFTGANLFREHFSEALEFTTSNVGVAIPFSVDMTAEQIASSELYVDSIVESMVNAGTYEVELTLGGTLAHNFLLKEEDPDEEQMISVTKIERTITVLPAEVTLEVFGEADRIFTYGSEITCGSSYTTPVDWAVSDNGLVVEWTYRNNETNESTMDLPTDVGTYTVTYAVAEAFADNVVLTVTDGMLSYQITIEPRVIDLGIGERLNYQYVPGNSYEAPVVDLQSIGVLESDLDGLSVDVDYSGSGIDGKTTEVPTGHGVYYAEYRLEGEFAYRYKFKYSFVIMNVAITSEATDAAGLQLAVGYTDGPVLVGGWQVAEETSGIVYNLLGNWVVCLNPGLPEGTYTFKPVSGG